jgi:hypothetical protein
VHQIKALPPAQLPGQTPLAKLEAQEGQRIHFIERTWAGVARDQRSALRGLTRRGSQNGDLMLPRQGFGVLEAHESFATE